MEDSRFDQPPSRGLRSRRGCLTCRRRKVKCDEGLEACGNCCRLKLECTWGPSEPVQRSRVNRACYNCRRKKIRCRTEPRSAMCKACIQCGLICSNNPAPVEKERYDGELRAMLDAFFDGPHNFLFFTFLHRPTFIQVLDSDLVPKHLLLVMAAMVQRIRDPGGPADAWADESRNLVMREVFTKLSTANLQTLLLLHRYEENRGAHLHAWLLSGLAIRVAHALQLNVEHDNQPTTVREVRRRIMWSCVVMDSITESGVRPVSGIRPSELHIRLPCTESGFLRGQDSPDVRAHGTDLDSTMVAFRDSISAQMVSMSILRSQVVNYTFSYHPRNIKNLPGEVPWHPGAMFYRLQGRLDQWKMQLLPKFAVASKNLDPGSEIQLLTLHCLFHGSYCDLLRLGSILASLPANSLPTPPTEFLDICARTLLDHALAIAEAITHVFDSMKYCDSHVGICACLALRFLVIDRRPQDRDYLPLSDTRIQTAILGTAACARSISQWSDPIRRYLHAVCHICSKRGYTLFSDGYPEHGADEHLPVDTSRVPSPSLRTYGTFGTVRKEIDADDSEIHGSSNTVTRQENYAAQANGLTDAAQVLTGSTTFPATDPLLFPYDPLSEEDLQTFFDWANGTYDAVTTQALWNNNMLMQDYDNDQHSLPSWL